MNDSGIGKSIEGENLRDLVQQKGPFSLMDCLLVMKEAAKILGAEHQKGIIHRNLQPSQIFMKKDKSIVVADGKVAQEENFHYCAPEQLLGKKDLDARSNMYSLGAIIFFLASGHTPGEKSNYEACVSQYTQHKNWDLQEGLRDYPLAFLKLLSKMMEVERQNRFATMEEVLKTISQLEMRGVFAFSGGVKENFVPETKGKVVTQLLSMVLLPGEQKLGQRVTQYLQIQPVNRCQGNLCKQEWKTADVVNKEALVFEGKVWCPECLWKRFTHTMAGRKIGFVEKNSLGECWLGIKSEEEFIPGSPVLYLSRYLLKRNKKGWENMLKRIERGFNLASKIHSNFVMRVGRYTEDPEINFAYVPLEYIPGLTLAQFFSFLQADSKKLPWQESLALLRKLAQALASLHKSSLMHRNLAPANIHISLSGGLRLGNFAMTKSLAPGEPDLRLMPDQKGDNVPLFQEYWQEYWQEDDPKTAFQTEISKNAECVLGTLSYMSPEQILGNPVDHRTDLWAWGILAFELLQGKRPFPENNFCATLEAIQKAPIPAISAPIPAALAKIVTHALERKVEKRYGNALDIVHDLDLIQT